MSPVRDEIERVTVRNYYDPLTNSNSDIMSLGGGAKISATAHNGEEDKELIETELVEKIKNEKPLSNVNRYRDNPTVDTKYPTIIKNGKRQYRRYFDAGRNINKRKKRKKLPFNIPETKRGRTGNHSTYYYGGGYVNDSLVDYIEGELDDVKLGQHLENDPLEVDICMSDAEETVESVEVIIKDNEGKSKLEMERDRSKRQAPNLSKIDDDYGIMFALDSENKKEDGKKDQVDRAKLQDTIPTMEESEFETFNISTLEIPDFIIGKPSCASDILSEPYVHDDDDTTIASATNPIGDYKDKVQFYDAPRAQMDNGAKCTVTNFWYTYLEMYNIMMISSSVGFV